MRAWQNERGGVLIYVLMISMVLVAMVPLVLSLTTNTALSDQVSRNEKLATHLSIGGIESFIRYLDQYTSGDRTTYLDDFNGFVTNKQFTTPEGIQVTYSLTKSAMEDNLYSITASVTAGTGRTARSKEIVYQINASMGRPSVPEVTPDSRTDDILIKGIYLDADTGNHSGLESTDSSKNVTVEETAGLQKAIGNAITNITTSVLASVTSWDAQVASCGCTTMNGIDNNINYSSSVLQVIKVSGNISMDGSINYTWGSPSKPVIVIFEGPVYLKNGGTLNVYGDLIFKDRFETDGGMVIDVNKVNGDYGNLYALGMFDGKNGGTFSMDGMFYADAVDIQNNATFTASKMVVKGQIETKNQLTVNIPEGGTDLIIGSLMMGQNSTLQVPSGDILVEHDVVASQNQLNNVVISSGGNIAIGGTITLDNNNTVTTGGGTTSLVIPEQSTDPDAPPVTAPGWTPTRQ